MGDNETIQLLNEEIKRLRDRGISRKEISDGYHTFKECIITEWFYFL